jgi:hypothetical protein
MIGFRLASTTALAIAAAAWPAGAYAVTDQDVPVAPKAAPQVAASAPQDLRSPDARDAGLAREASPPQDLRSPDARDAGLAREASAPQDLRSGHASCFRGCFLRSPDTRAADRGPAVAAAESARVAPDASRPSVSDGFEWGDAGIGAAATLALVGVAGGTLLLVGRRRHRTRTT